jgi:hypothetical protein
LVFFPHDRYASNAVDQRAAIEEWPPRFRNAAAQHFLHEPFEPAPYWKVIMSVRVNVGAFGFKGTFVRLPLP